MTKVVLKRHRRHWKPEEDALLKALYDQKKPKEFIATRFSRSSLSIRRRASKLKLTRGWRLWTPFEDKILKKYFSHRDFEDIAIMLGRTVHAVKAMAQKIGLRRHTPWTLKDQEYVGKWYRKRPARILAHDLHHSEGSIRRIADKLGLTRSIPRKHWTESDVVYLRKHLDRMTHEELAQKLGRTTWAIGAKASRLRLLKKPRLIR